MPEWQRPESRGDAERLARAFFAPARSMIIGERRSAWFRQRRHTRGRCPMLKVRQPIQTSVGPGHHIARGDLSEKDAPPQPVGVTVDLARLMVTGKGGR